MQRYSLNKDEMRVINKRVQQLIEQCMFKQLQAEMVSLVLENNKLTNASHVEQIKAFVDEIQFSSMPVINLETAPLF